MGQNMVQIMARPILFPLYEYPTSPGRATRFEVFLCHGKPSFTGLPLQNRLLLSSSSSASLVPLKAERAREHFFFFRAFLLSLALSQTLSTSKGLSPPALFRAFQFSCFRDEISLFALSFYPRRVRGGRRSLLSACCTLS